MRVCFIHQNLPTQYRYLIVSMLQRGDEVIVIGEQAVIDRVKLRHPKFNLLGYSVPPENQRPAVPQHLREFDLQVGRGQAVAKALRMLREKRLEPDLIFVHPGWGEAMFIRNECPQTPLVGYCESFHRARSAEHGFDPEFAFGPAVLHQMQIRKLPHLLALDEMDAGICPSEWQRARRRRLRCARAEARRRCHGRQLAAQEGRADRHLRRAESGAARGLPRLHARAAAVAAARAGRSRGDRWWR